MNNHFLGKAPDPILASALLLAVLIPIKLEFHGTDTNTDTDIRDAPIV